VADPKKYQVLKLIGKGGTAVLYKAIQTSLDRVVAVKKLHQHLTEDENFTRRFVLEAKAAASLDHSNIVNIIDFGTEDLSYYMVMEYIEGESLRDLLDKWKQFPVDVALAICYEVLGGLTHAHSKGIVHRDIKPGNIMVTGDGQCKITDFGLAKLLEGATHHTADNTLLGTPLYMSPEQANGESVDQRSDLFSLGTMLYEMITGVQAFRDQNYMGVIQNILKKNAPHPSKFNVMLDAPVQSLLSKSMNKSRDARFQNAAAFRKAIEKYLGHTQLSEARLAIRHLLATEGATVMLPKTLVSRERKSRLRRGAIAAIAVVTVAGAAGIGYTLAPEALQQQVQNKLQSLVGSDRPTAVVQDAVMGDKPGGYLASLYDDSTAAQAVSPAAADSTSAAPSDTSLIEPDGEPLSAKAQTEQQSEPTTAVTTAPTEATLPPTGAPTGESAPSPVQQEIIKMGWLSITSDPWAGVYIDNRYRGDTPLEIELTAGVHALECRNQKCVTYQEDIHITTGELSRRSVVLKQLVGHLAITATEGAEVLIDGVLVGITPLKGPLEIGAGQHQVTVKKAGFNVWNNQIEVLADKQLPLNITLSPIY
jgi:tRNA A-37 threonylcarbamoyl transferase component Bud32